MTSQAFERLVEIVSMLRHPEKGCPWDLEQTHESIRPYLIEEAYEVLEAIDSRNDSELVSELGDLLLQVVLHSQIAADRAAFQIDDVLERISAKLVRRHPHVFANTKVEGTADVLRNWERIKFDERTEKEKTNGEKASVLSGIPQALPALLRAQRLGEKAAKVSFDWKELHGVIAKVHEEFSELQHELRGLSSKTDAQPRLRELRHELGDVLFSLCQLARWLGLSAEDSLRECCLRFTARFREMEENARRPLHDLSEAELDAAWEEAKKKLADRGF